MSKAVLMSIKPKWVELIFNGRKTIEMRRTLPKLETPFKCYIYCTSGKPLVVGDHFDGRGFTTEYTVLYGYSQKKMRKLYMGKS